MKAPSLFTSIFGLLVLVIAWSSATYAESKPELVLEQSIVGGLTEIPVGENFTLNLRYRCASTTMHCENVQITSTVLPPEIDGSKVYPAGTSHVETVNYSSRDRVVTWDFIDPLPAGSTGELTLSLAFENGTTPDGTTFTNIASMTADNADNVDSNEVTITAKAEPKTTFEKTLRNGGNRVGGDAFYRIKMCHPAENGQLEITNYTLTDALPAGAEFVSATEDGVYDASTNTITWPQARLIAASTYEKCFQSDVIIRFPTDNFSVNQEVVNTATLEATYPGIEETVIRTSQVSHVLAEGALEGVVINRSKEGLNSITMGETLSYGFKLYSEGDTATDNVVITDPIPPQLDVTTITAGNNNQPEGSITVAISYQSNVKSEWTAVTGSPFATPAMQTVDVSELGLAEGEYITNLRWEISPLPAGFQNPRVSSAYYPHERGGFTADILSVDRNGQAVESGDIINNVATVTYPDENGDIITKTMTRKTTVETAQVRPKALKFVIGGDVAAPGDEVSYQLRVENTWGADANLLSPSVADLLPEGLEFVSWKWTTWAHPSDAPEPIVEVVDNFNNTGRTLVRWTWEDYALTPETRRLAIEFNARVKPGTLAGTLENTAVVSASNPESITDLSRCSQQLEDINDLDKDGDVAEIICVSNPASSSVTAVASMDSIKWVKGQLDQDWHKYPAYGYTTLGGTLKYRLVVKNPSNVAMTKVKLVDILPHIGDVGTIDLSQRETQWAPQLIGAVEAPAGVKVFYSQSANPCRIEPTSNTPAGCEAPAWSTSLPEDITQVRSLMFDFGDIVIDPQDSFSITWPMYAPVDSTVDSIAWNSFGFIAQRTDTGENLLPSEPIKVGIMMKPIEPAVYGDYVWLDFNGDGIQDEGENAGVNGVRVELYQPGEDNLPNTEDDVFVGFKLTANDEQGRAGYYKFSYLEEGDYFAKFFPPVGYKISPANVGEEDTIDSDVNPETLMTPVTHLDEEEFDLTWDMGLVEKGTAALGNYVWFDRDENGQQNESSSDGINDVEVTLYAMNGDQLVEMATTTTANDVYGQPGYYLFEELTAGSYVVEFALPTGATFTTQNAAESTENNNSDVDVNTGRTSAIRLLQAILIYAGMQVLSCL